MSSLLHHLLEAFTVKIIIVEKCHLFVIDKFRVSIGGKGKAKWTLQMMRDEWIHDDDEQGKITHIQCHLVFSIAIEENDNC